MDRRYVWKPTPGVEIPESCDEPGTGPAVGKVNGLDSRRSQEQHTLDRSRRSSNTDSVPLSSTRERSPYLYSSSGRSTFSGNYALSPDPFSPDARLPSRDARDKPIHLHRSSGSFSDYGRSISSSFAKGEQPDFGRYTAPGSQREISPAVSRRISSRRDEACSDESDVSPYEADKIRSRRRKSRRSSLKKNPEFQSASRYPEVLARQTTTTQQAESRPITPTQPRRPILIDLKTLPRHHSQSFGSSGSMTAPLPSKLPASGPTVLKSTPSLYASSNLTPPHSPRLDSRRPDLERPPSDKKPQSIPRPQSPLTHLPPRSPRLQVPLKEQLNDHRPAYASLSRHTSPLPSPDLKFRRKDGNSRPSLQTPLLASRPRSISQGAESSVPMDSTELPFRPRETSMPFVSSQPPRLTRLNIPTVITSRSATNVNEGQPREEDRHRRASDQAHSPILKQSRPRATSKAAPYLPRCPRSTFQSGYHDWSTIAGCPNFDVCPSCRAGIEDAGFEGQFFPSPQRSSDFQTRCDLSNPWTRMAWLLVLRRKSAQRNLVHEIMNVLSTEQPCPGKVGAVREWYRLYDPENGKQISNFAICRCCIRNIETIFPRLQNVFQLAKLNNPMRKRMCDLRSDSMRFPQYVDLLEETSQHATEFARPPNMLRFVQLVKKMASIQECNRDDMLLGQSWHFMPHMPEFTVCEECYHQAVWPAIAGGSDIAAHFNRTLQSLPPSPMGASCQLYSPRMRQFFDQCCRKQDWVGLTNAVRQRTAKERDLQSRLARLRIYGGDSAGGEAADLVEEWKKWE